MAMIDIGGVQVDDDKPCDMAKALRSAMLIIGTGRSISVARFGDDEMRYGPANVGLLREMLGRYEGLCAASQGKRQRYAKTMRFVR